MSEILINKNEIEFLERELKSKLIKSNVHRNLSEINWNSNPENYNTLISTVFNDDTSRKKLGSTFLRDLFYKKEEHRNVREKNVNTIYNYLFKKTRRMYLDELNINFDAKKYYFYSVKPLAERQDKILEETKLDIDFRLFQNESDSVISSQYKNTKTGVCFYIDRSFIKSHRCIRILLELFTETFISLIINYNIKFIFDDDILTDKDDFTISTYIGREKIYKSWKKETEHYNDQDSWFCKKFDNKKPFLTILENIKRFSEESNIQKKLSVDRFLPLLTEINNLNVNQLREIYEESEDEDNGSEYNIIGVIGYNGYYNNNEKDEMLKYFYLYQEALEKANKVRIFTIPAKKIKGKGWSSQLNPEINELLYQYVYMNIYNNKIETYLLMFDEDKIGNDSNIMWHQDYVIRMKKNVDFEYKNGKIAKSLFKEHKRRRKGIEDDKLTRLYFAYPEDNNGVNQMIKLEGGPDTKSNKIYIKKMEQDFMNRISLLMIEQKYAQIQLVNNNKESLRHILNLNTLGTTLFDRLESEVELFYSEIDA